MTDCYRVGFVEADGTVHPTAPATHQVDLGHRGDPLPVCASCAAALDNREGAADLLSPIEGAS